MPEPAHAVASPTPNDEPASRRMAWELIASQRYPEGVEVLRYVASAPGDPVGLRRLGLALLGSGEAGEASSGSIAPWRLT